MLTVKRLREVLDYNKETGVFTCKIPRPRNKVGDVPGTISSAGYVVIMIDGRLYRAHRLAWLYVYGEWPRLHIDHINGVRHDNRICNLRDVTRSENMRNLHRAKKTSASGILGVSWNKKCRKWRADKHMRYIGLFDTIEDAKAAWDAA